MAEDSNRILLKYLMMRRKLNMVSGICFLIYIIVFPALYFILTESYPYSNLYPIIYVPFIVCLIIQTICGFMILHYRHKALTEIASNAYTQAAQVQQGTALPYPNHPQGIGTLPQMYALPPGSTQRFNNGQNAAQFSDAVRHQQFAPPPSYSQVMADEQHREPPNAGWVISAGESAQPRP